MYHIVYVLKSLKDGNLYIGCTKNLNERLNFHNTGKVSSTKLRKPFQLIYAEVYRNKKDAYRREKFLKTGWGRNYLKRVLKNYLSK